MVLYVIDEEYSRLACLISHSKLIQASNCNLISENVLQSMGK